MNSFGNALREAWRLSKPTEKLSTLILKKEEDKKPTVVDKNKTIKDQKVNK